MTVQHVTFDGIVAYHTEVMLAAGQSPLLLWPERLEAAVARPQSTAFGEDAFPSLAEKAAALLQAIVIGHAFLDGNKRAGLGAMLAFLELNDVNPLDANAESLYELVMAVTTGESREVDEIAERLRALFDGLG